MADTTSAVKTHLKATAATADTALDALTAEITNAVIAAPAKTGLADQVQVVTEEFGTLSGAIDGLTVEAPPPTLARPTAPTGVAVVEITETTAKIVWNANPADQFVDKYQVYVNGPAGSYTPAHETAETTFVISHPLSHERYTVNIGAHNASVNNGGFGPWSLPTITVIPPDAPPPPPTTTGTFDNPFPRSPMRRRATGVAFDPETAKLVGLAINAARNCNSGRGPTIFGSGEKRYRSKLTDPLWTLKGSGFSYQIHAPADLTDSGSADPTNGIYQDDGVTARMWGGDSTPIRFDRTNRIATASSLGVDTDSDGAPNQGTGTAGGRMSGDGIMLPRDVPEPKTRIKFALGNNLNARSYRGPARSYESKSTGSPYPNGVPHGTTFVHLWTDAEVEAAIKAAGITSGNKLACARSFWKALSYERGFGAVLLDGTGNNGFNIYLNSGELGLSGADTQHIVRLHPAGSASAQCTNLWKDLSKWRALVAG